MPETGERVCVGCGESETETLLETCRICARPFCANCAHRGGFGHRFCSTECTRAYYFSGDPDDDDENSESEE